MKTPSHMTVPNVTVPLSTLNWGDTFVLPASPNEVYGKIVQIPASDPPHPGGYRLSDGEIQDLSDGAQVISIPMQAVRI